MNRRRALERARELFHDRDLRLILVGLLMLPCAVSLFLVLPSWTR